MSIRSFKKKAKEPIKKVRRTSVEEILRPTKDAPKWVVEQERPLTPLWFDYPDTLIVKTRYDGTHRFDLVHDESWEIATYRSPKWWVRIIPDIDRMGSPCTMISLSSGRYAHMMDLHVSFKINEDSMVYFDRLADDIAYLIDTCCRVNNPSVQPSSEYVTHSFGSWLK